MCTRMLIFTFSFQEQRTTGFKYKMAINATATYVTLLFNRGMKLSDILKKLDSKTHQSVYEIPSEKLHPKNDDIDRLQYTDQCDNGQDTVQYIPQDKTQGRQRPRKQAKPQKCISGRFPTEGTKSRNNR